jgi:hypothetical protein
MPNRQLPNGATVYRPAAAAIDPADPEQLFEDALTRLLQPAAGSKATDDRLTEVAALVSEVAHQRGLPPEQMLIRVKSKWASVAAARLHVASDEFHDTEERLVTRCIEAYYAPLTRRPA